MSVADLPALGRLAADAGVPAAVDNTFASPYLCNPAAFGFAYVIHSATKYLGGHHDLTGGVVCCSGEDRARLRATVIDTGGTMAPFEAWLAMRGTMTLRAADGPARGERAGAGELPRGAIRRSARVHYPGLASHPDHEVARAGAARRRRDARRSRSTATSRPAMRVCDALELAWVATSLGGTHTLVGHAASTTHRQMDPRSAGRGRDRRRPDPRERRPRGRGGPDRGLRPGAGEGVTRRRGSRCCSAGAAPSTRSRASRRGR